MPVINLCLFVLVSGRDKMGEALTDGQGRFQIDGNTTELTNIEPELYIYHDCNDKSGLIKGTIQIDTETRPSSQISSPSCIYTTTATINPDS